MLPGDGDKGLGQLPQAFSVSGREPKEASKVQRLSQRIGVQELLGFGNGFMAPPPGLTGIAEREQSRGQVAQCHHPLIEGVQRGKGAVPRRVVKRQDALRMLPGRGEAPKVQRGQAEGPVRRDQQRRVALPPRRLQHLLSDPVRGVRLAALAV